MFKALYRAVAVAIAFEGHGVTKPTKKTKEARVTQVHVSPITLLSWHLTREPAEQHKSCFEMRTRCVKCIPFASALDWLAKAHDAGAFDNEDESWMHGPREAMFYLNALPYDNQDEVVNVLQFVLGAKWWETGNGSEESEEEEEEEEEDELLVPPVMWVLKMGLWKLAKGMVENKMELMDVLGEVERRWVRENRRREDFEMRLEKLQWFGGRLERWAKDRAQRSQAVL